jgi:hypothetical protein
MYQYLPNVCKSILRGMSAEVNTGKVTALNCEVYKSELFVRS